MPVDVPQDVDYYIIDEWDHEIELRVYHYTHPLRNTYLFRAGIVTWQLNEHEFDILRSLIQYYDEMTGTTPPQECGFWRTIWNAITFKKEKDVDE